MPLLGTVEMFGNIIVSKNAWGSPLLYKYNAPEEHAKRIILAVSAQTSIYINYFN